ncbi:hypothetical protein AB0J80_26035 [Actinoplanes sp. NPDC049548]|uniref:hypothetical protein n=1 Tax=Actinoplanes sp. NPDC049548 TaxID=3155152 RepID=UPI0034325DF5
MVRRRSWNCKPGTPAFSVPCVGAHDSSIGVAARPTGEVLLDAPATSKADSLGLKPDEPTTTLGHPSRPLDLAWRDPWTCLNRKKPLLSFQATYEGEESMTALPDPGEAARALSLADRQRRHAIIGTDEPLWVYVAAAMMMIILLAVTDFAPRWFDVVFPVLVLLTIAWQKLPRLSPGLATAFGRRAYGVPLPPRVRLMYATIGIMYVATGIVAVGADLPRRFGAPTFMVEHNLAITGTIVTLVFIPLSWVIERAVRHRLSRTPR